jgi:8-oxo-dGTP diphosphatase
VSFKKLSSEQIRLHKGISFPGITTVFICHDSHGKLLLGKRGRLARDEHGHWDFGAGGLKQGQSLEDNLKRELKEEYDVEPIEINFIGYLDAFRKNDDGNITHWLAMVFAVQVDPDKVKINEPGVIDEIGWFSLGNLPKPMHSQFDAFMRKHGEKLRQYLEL